jgi:hypothetical protein
MLPHRRPRPAPRDDLSLATSITPCAMGAVGWLTVPVCAMSGCLEVGVVSGVRGQMISRVLRSGSSG